MKKTNLPLISVCIPVFQTEELLSLCLESLVLQAKTFLDFEVVIVNDCSHSFNSKKQNCKKIIKIFSKQLKQNKTKINVTYIEHSQNLGLLETRRSAVTNAKGKYIFILDSDDFLPPQALGNFAAAALEQDYPDILQGNYSYKQNDVNSTATTTNQNIEPFTKLNEKEILQNWLMEGKHRVNLWAKLIKTTVYLTALEQIPFTQCNIAEDFLQYFFISLYAKNWVYVPQQVYTYNVNSGMTSNRKIDTLQKWQMVCSTASVFTILSIWINQHQNSLTQEQILSVKKWSATYLHNNLVQLNQTVIPEIQPQAKEMLKEYWGPEFVTAIEHSFFNKNS